MNISLYIAFGILLFVSIMQTIRVSQKIEKVNELEETQANLLLFLGYYRIRFGYVSPENVLSGEGLTEDMLKEYTDFVNNSQSEE